MTRPGAHQRFRRVAERRTSNVLEAIRVLGNCSNKSAYDYSPEEVDKIFKAIEQQIRVTKARFGVRTAPEEFMFDSAEVGR